MAFNIFHNRSHPLKSFLSPQFQKKGRSSLWAVIKKYAYKYTYSNMLHP